MKVVCSLHLIWFIVFSAATGISFGGKTLKTIVINDLSTVDICYVRRQIQAKII